MTQLIAATTSHCRPGKAAAPPAAGSAAAPSLSESLVGLAKTEYSAARILYQDGDYEGALLKLKSAHYISHDPRLLWDMAACEKNLRHYAAVMRLVEEYLATGEDVVTAQERAYAKNLVDTVKNFVTDFTVEASESGATVTMDDHVIGTTPFAEPVRVDMGKHELRVVKKGFADVVVTQNLPGGRPSHVTVKLTPASRTGSIRIVAGANDVIQIDGKVVGTGLYSGEILVGAHLVYVSAAGKRGYQTEANVQEDDVTTVQVRLEDDPSSNVLQSRDSGIPTWVWIAGSAVLVGGGVGAFFLFRDRGYESKPSGSWASVSL